MQKTPKEKTTIDDSREKDTIYKLIKHWNLEGDQEAELRDFINQQLETQKQEIIGVVEKRIILDNYFDSLVSEIMRNGTITTPEFAIKVMTRNFNKELEEIINKIKNL